jgi:hypothetical protein
MKLRAQYDTVSEPLGLTPPARDAASRTPPIGVRPSRPLTERSVDGLVESALGVVEVEPAQRHRVLEVRRGAQRQTAEVEPLVRAVHADQKDLEEVEIR